MARRPRLVRPLLRDRRRRARARMPGTSHRKQGDRAPKARAAHRRKQRVERGSAATRDIRGGRASRRGAAEGRGHEDVEGPPSSSRSIRLPSPGINGTERDQSEPHPRRARRAARRGQEPAVAHSPEERHQHGPRRPVARGASPGKRVCTRSRPRSSSGGHRAVEEGTRRAHRRGARPLSRLAAPGRAAPRRRARAPNHGVRFPHVRRSSHERPPRADLGALRDRRRRLHLGHCAANQGPHSLQGRETAAAGRPRNAASVPRRLVAARGAAGHRHSLPYPPRRATFRARSQGVPGGLEEAEDEPRRGDAPGLTPRLQD